ncbi:ribbon-helix-helix protein [Dongia mobilis]|uniref:Ribbon-helix-helix protein n=1 Tax=Dongia mobilis TaxID=578943 RepID=A0A4R6WLV2_9PROT|nr:ribbon-helix-helix domain-containing protein [Dongia mobilis]TDQ78987.1 ribbon-helix-helix protein [Dongia mobilis]
MTSPAPTRLRKRSVNIAGHSTSVTLEQIFWDSLRDIAQRRGQSVSAVIEEIDQARAEDPGAPNLSSAIRVFVLRAALEL